VTRPSARRPSNAAVRRGLWGRWRSAALGCATLLAGVLIAGCGSSGPPPAWRSGHPDPASLGLLDSAQAGSCASTAPDPDQAPVAISFDSQEYVQSSSEPATTSVANAVEIDHTGDWAFWDNDDGDLTMTTPTADYLYQLKSC